MLGKTFGRGPNRSVAALGGGPSTGRRSHHREKVPPPGEGLLGRWFKHWEKV